MFLGITGPIKAVRFIKQHNSGFAINYTFSSELQPIFSGGYIYNTVYVFLNTCLLYSYLNVKINMLQLSPIQGIGLSSEAHYDSGSRFQCCKMAAAGSHFAFAVIAFSITVTLPCFSDQVRQWWG